MLQITATELARKFKQMMNLVEFQGEELIIVRNNHQVARIIPGPATMTALEAMSDLYRTLPEDAGATWIKDSREGVTTADLSEVRDPGLPDQHRVQDLWLASQAIQHGLTLLTYNGKDFIDIPGLSLRVL